jgi:hypothetical protein
VGVAVGEGSLSDLHSDDVVEETNYKNAEPLEPLGKLKIERE